METKKVIFDTNFLLAPYKYRINIFLEVKYIVPGVQFIISKGIVNELKSLSERKGRTSLEAKFALKILERHKEEIDIISSTESVDKWILNYAKKYRAIVCTDDIMLKNLLKKEKLRVIMVKARSKVDFV